MKEILNSFEESASDMLQENLKTSMLGVCFNAVIAQGTTTQQEKRKIKKLFFDEWRKAAKRIIQNSMRDLNQAIKADNLDLIDIIKPNIHPTTEEYQETYTRAIQKCERLYKQIVDDNDNLNNQIF
jgi:hypothetical protein